jgi:hypothetical protein
VCIGTRCGDPDRAHLLEQRARPERRARASLTGFYGCLSSQRYLLLAGSYFDSVALLAPIAESAMGALAFGTAFGMMRHEPSAS